MLDLKLEVKDLSKNVSAAKNFSFEENWESLESSKDKRDKIVFIKPLTFKGTASNIGTTILVSGDINTAVQLSCSRCLKPFDLPIDAGYNQEFCHEKDKSINEECRLFDGGIIDFTQTVTEELILSLPMKWLCQEECQGLCPYCGKDRNENSCNCKEEDVDPRLEVLKKFFDKE